MFRSNGQLHGELPLVPGQLHAEASGSSSGMNNAACCCMKIVAANGPRVVGVGGLQAWVVQSSVATMVVALVMATACAAQIARAAPAVVSAFYMVRFSSRQRRAGS